MDSVSFNPSGCRTGDSLRTCHFDPTHQVLAHCFTAHLANCAKKYRGNFAKCKFDFTHQYPEPYIKHHEALCPARRLLDRDRQLIASSGDTLMGDVKGPEIIAARFNNDEWDLECSPENSGRGMSNIRKEIPPDYEDVDWDNY